MVSASFFEYFGIYLSLSLFYCLNADLILMIKYPFKDKQSRMKFYLTACFIASISVAVIVTSVINNSQLQKTWPFYFFVLGYGAIVFISVASSIFAYKKLSKPGISGEIRTTILKRHILAIVLYLVFNLYIYVSSLAALGLVSNTNNLVGW